MIYLTRQDEDRPPFMLIEHRNCFHEYDVFALFSHRMKLHIRSHKPDTLVNPPFYDLELGQEKGIMRMWLILSFVHFLCCTVVSHVGKFDDCFAGNSCSKRLFALIGGISCIFRNLLIYSSKPKSKSVHRVRIIS